MDCQGNPSKLVSDSPVTLIPRASCDRTYPMRGHRFQAAEYLILTFFRDLSDEDLFDALNYKCKKQAKLDQMGSFLY